MKEHQTDHIHKRFYVFSHVDGEDIKYRKSNGDWTDDFHDCMLWKDESFAVKKAAEFKESHASWVSNLLPDNKEQRRRFVVGCAIVEVNPLYAMKVA